MPISEQVLAAQRERDARLWATGVVLLPCLAATGGRPTVLVGALGLAACSWADALVGREAGAALLYATMSGAALALLYAQLGADPAVVCVQPPAAAPPCGTSARLSHPSLAEVSA